MIKERVYCLLELNAMQFHTRTLVRIFNDRVHYQSEEPQASQSRVEHEENAVEGISKTTVGQISTSKDC